MRRAARRTAVHGLSWVRDGRRRRAGGRYGVVVRRAVAKGAAVSIRDAHVARWQRSLELPDPYPLLAVVGAAAGNLLGDGEPVWLVLVGPPSSGKGELLTATLG